jgi:hypothetical protein
MLCSQLLVELDGADQRHGVYVIGATNRCCQLLIASLSMIIPEWEVDITVLFLVQN